MEVKSGSSRNSLGSVDHRAQVILYTMMLEERYKDSVDSGILYYIKGKQTIGVPSSAVERRALIMKRNEIASAFFGRKIFWKKFFEKNFFGKKYFLKKIFLIWQIIELSIKGGTLLLPLPLLRHLIV